MNKVQQKKLFTYPQFSFRFFATLFVAVTSFVTLLSSGVLESQDSWLYVSVAKNIYYNHKIEAIPDYYPKLNVHMNSSKGEDGVWRAPGSLGYSFAMVPAVALSDLVHRIEGSVASTYFPLEHDWPLHFFASMTNAFFAGLLVVVLTLYLDDLTHNKSFSALFSILILVTTNLLPLSKHGFAHVLFTTFVVLSFYFVRRFALTRNVQFLIGLFLSFCVVYISYNVSYYIPIIPLVVYYLLLLPKSSRVRSIIALLVLSIPVLILKWKLLMLIVLGYMHIYPKVVFEGVWGFLFSSGKSVFLYSPPLLIPLIFWHLFPKKYVAELIAFSLLIGLYLYLFGMAWIYNSNGLMSPIWYGGMSWGPRYVSTLIPFVMILAGLIVVHIQKKFIYFVLIPLFVSGVWVQLIGVSMAYQLQYQNTTPYSLYVNEQELSVYDYASFIPRFSPLYVMSREFFVKIRKFPESRSHGLHNVWFYDGFEVPLFTGNGPYRGFREEGHIFFDSTVKDPAEKLYLSFYNAPDIAESTSSAKIAVVLNTATIGNIEVESSKNAAVTISIPKDRLLDGRNSLDLLASYPATTSATQIVYISQMVINDTPVNLESLDYPEVSTAGDKNSAIKYQYFGKKMNDRWKLWYLRARISERTFDFWWIKNLYYWDRPQKAIAVAFVVNVIICLVSWIQLRKFWKTR